jgi:hypothetical protein
MPQDPGCKKEGIRYAGRGPSGVAVCFTLTPDTKTWLEIGYLAVQTRKCAGTHVGAYFPEPLPGIDAGWFSSDFFSARIRGSSASGTIHDPDFCNGKRFKWAARATQPLTAEVLRNLKPSPTGVCTRRGIHYVGTSVRGRVQICFTLNHYRSSLIESGWRFGRGNGCGGVAAGESVESTYKTDLFEAGRFDDEGGLTGRVRGDKASGLLRDADSCPGKTFRWSGRRVP